MSLSIITYLNFFLRIAFLWPSSFFKLGLLSFACFIRVLSITDITYCLYLDLWHIFFPTAIFLLILTVGSFIEQKSLILIYEICISLAL